MANRKVYDLETQHKGEQPIAARAHLVASRLLNTSRPVDEKGGRHQR